MQLISWNGFSVPASIALFQTSEAAIRLTVGILWSHVTYRVCYSAYAKKDQSYWNLGKTALNGLCNKAAVEAVLIVLLMLSTALAGFYTTVLTAYLPKTHLYEEVRSAPVSHTYPGHDYPAGGYVDVLARALDLPDGSKFVPGLNGETEIQQAPSHYEFLELTDTYRTRRDNVGAGGTGRERLSLCANYVTRATEMNAAGWARYDNLDCLWAANVGQDVLSKLPHAQHWASGAWAARTPFFPGFAVAWTSSNSSTEHRIYAKLGEPLRALVQSEVKILTYTLSVNTSAYEAVAVRSHNDTAQGTYVRRSVYYNDGSLIEETNYRKVTFGATGLAEIRDIALGRQTIMVGQPPGESEVALAEPYQEITHTAKYGQYWQSVQHLEKYGSPELNLGFSTTMIVAEYRVITEKVMSGYIEQEGYTLAAVAACVGPVFFLMIMAVIVYTTKLAFETNSITENLYVNNNVELNDCASNLRQATRRWWHAESWATQHIWVGTLGSHISVVVGDKMLKAYTPPLLLERLRDRTKTAGMSSARDYWHEWSEEHMQSKTPLMYVQAYTLRSKSVRDVIAIAQARKVRSILDYVQTPRMVLTRGKQAELITPPREEGAVLSRSTGAPAAERGKGED